MTEHTIETNGSESDVARWVWRHLVPKSGQASSVQGELLRIVEKLRWEAQNNGNGNWDDRFTMLVDFLRTVLGGELQLPKAMRKLVAADLNCLDEGLYLEDDLYDRLEKAVVAFCRLHPEVIAKELDPLQYR